MQIVSVDTMVDGNLKSQKDLNSPDCMRVCLLVMVTLLVLSGCSRICQSDYDACRSQIDTKNPAFKLLRIVNGVYSQ